MGWEKKEVTNAERSTPVYYTVPGRTYEVPGMSKELGCRSRAKRESISYADNEKHLQEYEDNTRCIALLFTATNTTATPSQRAGSTARICDHRSLARTDHSEST